SVNPFTILPAALASPISRAVVNCLVSLIRKGEFVIAAVLELSKVIGKLLFTVTVRGIFTRNKSITRPTFRISTRGVGGTEHESSLIHRFTIELLTENIASSRSNDVEQRSLSMP